MNHDGTIDWFVIHESSNKKGEGKIAVQGREGSLGEKKRSEESQKKQEIRMEV